MIHFLSKFAFLSLALCIFLMGGCKEGAKTEAKETLVVGMDLSYPPFETIDKDGNPAGISVDIAHALGKSLGKKIVVENIPFVGLIPSLKTGKIDLILSSMTATRERRGSINFSNPYLTTGLALLVRKGTLAKNLKELDVPGRTFVVRQGTTGAAYAAQNIVQAKVVTLDTEANAVMEVVQGKADAFIYDQMSVWKNWQENPDTTDAVLEPFQLERWAIGLRKTDQALQQQVNTFLQQFKASGGFDELGDKYLAPQKAAFKAQNIPFVF